MQAILGKIMSIAGESSQLEVSFKPVCIMPQRTGVPEWLKDQTLKINRNVPDAREVGGPGDSIVLTPDESAKWLYPLIISPDIAYDRLPDSQSNSSLDSMYNKLPDAITLKLRWWKDDNPPDYTVRANGRLVTGKFTKNDNAFSAEIKTNQLYDAAPALPVEIEVTCDKLKLTCSVLPGSEPFYKKLTTAQGELHRVENDWYAVDITAKSRGGGIIGLREKSRNVDHFRTPDNLIHEDFEIAGHADCLQEGWHSREYGFWPKTKNVVMTAVGASREDRSTRLALDGVIDESAIIRTSVAYAVHDDFPLITWRREYYYHPGKPPEEKKDQPQPPKEPIDDAKPMGVGFFAAWMAERNGASGSRIICSDGERCRIYRCAQLQESTRARNWNVHHGWIIAEHPGRRECSMYLFDDTSLPKLKVVFSTYSISLEPWWQVSLLKPGSSVGQAVGLSAGELCGATIDSAWTACRICTLNGIRCAAIARIPALIQNPTAIFTLGGNSREVTLEKVMIPGLGCVSRAIADFDSGSMDDEFDAVVAGIESRRTR